jgi:hypothetical protein
MNYLQQAARYLKKTHPFIPSLEREGKPAGEPARRGDLKPKQASGN